MSHLIKQLDQVVQIATASKFRRMLAHPLKYMYAIAYKTLVYPTTKRSKEVLASTFFEERMTLLLPASTDIYLTGGKSHNSEIRLAKFMIHHLSKGDCVLDIGAHYGYFTLLAAKIVGNDGQVVAFEASSKAFEILTKNTSNKKNITPLNKVVSDSVGKMEFYEFPNLYSEYNSRNIHQFENQTWFIKAPPEKKIIDSIDLTSFLQKEAIVPSFLKIDVEGAEFEVIKGLKTYLQSNTPIIAMEYLTPERGNTAHQKAVALLKELGYNSYLIGEKEDLLPIHNIDEYLITQQLESDNIVFQK